MNEEQEKTAFLSSDFLSFFFFVLFWNSPFSLLFCCGRHLWFWFAPSFLLPFLFDFLSIMKRKKRPRPNASLFGFSKQKLFVHLSVDVLLVTSNFVFFSNFLCIFCSCSIALVASFCCRSVFPLFYSAVQASVLSFLRFCFSFALSLSLDLFVCLLISALLFIFLFGIVSLF